MTPAHFADQIQNAGTRWCPVTETHGAETQSAKSTRPVPPRADGLVANLSMHRCDICRYVTGLGVPKRVVEELAQDTLIAAHRRYEEFRGDSSLRTWLRGIAFHLVLNWRRRRANREICEAMDHDGAAEAKGQWNDLPQASALDAYRFKELCLHVEDVLCAQSESARRLWRMVVLEDTAVSSASLQLEMNHSQATLLLAKTNRRIRGALLARQMVHAPK
jgi:RNA polymerase sigma factor (sigma-70 family)